MKHRLSISQLNFLLVLILSLTSINCYSQTSQPFSINESPLPAPTSPVMDYAGVLDAGTKQALEKRVIDFRDRTNPKVELAVAIVKTTGDRPIFDYSLAVARGWKIGSKADDNPSALLFIAIDDRKYFTQISKDLEDELPDGLAGQLQRQHLVPAFKQGNYGKGISDTIDAYIRTIEAKGNGGQVTGVTNPPERAGTRRNQEKGAGGICGTVICLIILFVILISIFSRFGSSSRRGGYNRSNWNSGGFGGSAVPWIIGSVIANSMDNSRSSSSSDWGGGSSGGGDSWGGFGGGGDFGGGGAGGDW
jgi:uncharacterized protein